MNDHCFKTIVVNLREWVGGIGACLSLILMENEAFRCIGVGLAGTVVALGDQVVVLALGFARLGHIHFKKVLEA